MSDGDPCEWAPLLPIRGKRFFVFFLPFLRLFSPSDDVSTFFPPFIHEHALVFID